MNYKKKCNICLGSGLMKLKPVVCKYCNGKICIHCQQKGGLLISPYERCIKCDGSGEINSKN